MNREQKWELIYAVPTEEGEVVKRCYPNSEEKRTRNIGICKDRGYRVISCKKLYPFSTEKNQHNFMLISNICSNRINDMWLGELPYDEAEIERLEALKEKADEFWELPLPVAWITWDKWEEAKQLATMAIEHRANACIESGRADLVQYCG